MSVRFLLPLFAVLLVGCGGGESANQAPDTQLQAAPGAKPIGSAGGGTSSPAPIGSGVAGGMTPMTGTESVEGAGGGGVQSAAKSMAKDKAAQAGGGSLNQMPAEEGN